VQGPHHAISHRHGALKSAPKAGLSIHPSDVLLDITTLYFFDGRGQPKIVFLGGLGVFQKNHLHSNEKVRTTMIYAGLYVSRMSVEAIVR
jgi:hypothetical protein